MREKSSAAKGMFMLSLAGMMVKVMSVVYTPFLTVILGDEGYGIYSKTTEIFLFVYALSCMGAQPAVTKVVAEYTALDNPKGAVKTLRVASRFYGFLGIILASLMMLLAVPLSKFAESPDSALGIRVLAPCIIITSLLAVLRGFMQGKNDMTTIAVSQIAEQILNVIISLLCAYILIHSGIEFGNAGAQVGTSIGALFACFYILYVYERKHYSREANKDIDADKKRRNKHILQKVIRYSVPITISAGLQNFGGIVDMLNVSKRLLVAGFTSSEANTLYGLLGKYKTLYGVPLVLITAIGTTVLPSLAKSIVLKERKEAKQKISYALKMAFMIAIPSAVGLSILSREVYIALYGSDRGSTLMLYGSVVLVLMSVTQIQSTVLQGINKLYYVLGTFSIGIVVKIIVNYILVGIYDINVYGVIVGNCLWHLIPAILNHRKICSIMKMRMPIIRLTIKPIIASLAMTMLIMILKQPLEVIYRFIPLTRITAMIVVVFLVAAGGFVYLYVMIVLGGIRKSDMESISPKIIRFIPRFMRIKLK
ncbi:MAG: polysaccharide biosynthesis protein [Clostridium sp.]|uniref:putative polysaccharide biosynthesis protein n=1 Tax=Clostridium sp. DSM 8431 TaxID=1761781 RepID=UPI0008E1B487|nr:polysaccharide biosynthesis protein [Clostridium sp. DSM 8431]MCR4943064.1 polysaccharide biosynthesis protein [Clostridium sp.]SFU43277.1 stage V sporulation protein B [Clostridium sp. DSM 8431]